MAPRVQKDVFAYASQSLEHAVKKLCMPLSRDPAVPALEKLPRGIESLPCTSIMTGGMPSQCQTSMESLEEDLLLHILRLAQPTAWDLCRMACVSRTWRRLCYSPVFWTKLRISSGSMLPGVEALAARCGTVVELHIDDPRCELFVLHPIVMACANSLQRVVLNCDRDTSSRNEASICSILWIISLHCKKVETLELVSDGARGGFQFLESKALWYVTSGFRNIQSFACLCQESITRQSLYLIVIAWRQLACLRVNCSVLFKEDLMCLRKCHNLVLLELFGGDVGKLLDGGKVAGGELQGAAPRAHDQIGQGLQPGFEAIHPDLEVLVLTEMWCCPRHLSLLIALFPGLQRVMVSRSSWARGTQAQVSLARKQLGALHRWLFAQRGVSLVIED